MSLLVTGATGFIGKELIKELQDYNGDIFILAREFSLKKAANLFCCYENIKLISGDITKVTVLDDYRDLELLKGVSKIIHVAGGYDIEMKVEAAYLQNVVGTQNIIALSKKLPNLKEFHFMSSFSVVGLKLDLADAHTFASDNEKLSPYAESKKQAEKMVRASFGENKNISLIIYRLGIVIPNQDGDLEKIDGAYYFLQSLIKAEKYLRFLPKQMLSFYPYDQKAYLPLISVRSVADFMGKVIRNNNQGSLQSYYVVSENKKSIRQFIEESFFNFNIGLILKPLPIKMGKRLMFGFGIFPNEISKFLFFRTKLIDEKRSVSQDWIEEHHHINVKKMVAQTKSFMSRGNHD